MLEANSLLSANRPRASPLSHGNLFATSSHKPITELTNSTDSQSLTLSYLQNSCGLSLKSAISASKKLHFQTTDKPDSVLNLLRTHGLTQTHIKNLITKRPLLLLADLNKTIKPNLELFESLGFTDTSLANMLVKEPRVLESDAKTIVKFFRANGFSEKQITTLTMKHPMLYVRDAQKFLKPKVDFFKSLGFSEIEIAKMLSSEPYILDRSMEKQIIPCIQFLRRILGTDENVVKAVRARYPVVECNVQKVLEPNVLSLIDHGVSESLVLRLLVSHPRSLLQGTDRFKEIVGEVKKLGFDPSKWLFVLAVRCMAVMSKTLWEKKLEAYMRFGFTKDEIYLAFKLQPSIMIVSEEKIARITSFFVEKLSMKPLSISKNPHILLLSLEKRILPRCSVLQLLMSKKLIKKDLTLCYMLRMPEKKFVEKLVKKYEHEFPEVVKAHQGKIQFEGFPFDLKM